MLDYLKKIYSKIGKDGIVLICVIFSVFFTFYLCVIIQFIALLYAMHKYSLKKIPTFPYVLFPSLLMIPALATGLYFKNYLGIVILCLFFLLYIFSNYEQYMMTPEIGDVLIKLAAIFSIFSALAAFIQKYPYVGFRATSTFVNANFYGYVCELMLVILIYAIYNFGPNPLFFISIAANIGGITASGCRSAWTAAAAGILVLMLLLKKYRHFIFSIAISAVAAILVLTVPQFIFPRYAAFTSDKSLRFLIWKTSLGYIKDNPLLGHGMFAYYALSQGRAHDAHSHNFILDLLVNFGIVGTLILAIFAFLVVRSLIKNLKHNKRCALALAVLTAAFVHGFTDVPFIGIQTSSFTALIVSLAGIYGNYAGNQSSSETILFGHSSGLRHKKP